MIHIATIHWKTDKWINLQNRYLRKHLRISYKTYAFLNDIDAKFDDCFDVVRKDDTGSHAEKLNSLARMICSENQDDDYILFLDGDAFPIAPVDNAFMEEVGKYAMAAIQRIENNGDIQPHPSFAMIKIGMWKKIGGTWEKGYTWSDKQGNRVTDLGGEMLTILETNQLEWMKITRTNLNNIHPLYFGVYGNLVYHHGAGFRRGKGGRISRFTAGELKFKTNRWSRLTGKIPISFIRYMLNPKERWLKKLEEEMVTLNDWFYNEIVSDEQFYLRLMEGDEA